MRCGRSGATPPSARWSAREAVRIFGTDKMGTADLFRLFMGKGPEEPTHVEWVNAGERQRRRCQRRGRGGHCSPPPPSRSTRRARTSTRRGARRPRSSLGGRRSPLLRVATTEDVKPAFSRRVALVRRGERQRRRAPARRGVEGRRDAARRGELARKPPRAATKRVPVGEVDSLDALMGMAPTLAEMAASKQTLGERMSQAPPSTFGGFDNLKDDLRSRLGKKVEL